eukprot:3299194-Rhodomonas_salina.1
MAESPALDNECLCERIYASVTPLECGTELACGTRTRSSGASDSCSLAFRYCDPVCCYAMSGTDIPYGAMRCLVLTTVWCYAMPGTDIPYGAMRCPVLTYRIVLCDV